MDYEAFKGLKEKPSGKTYSDSPINGQFALDFASADFALLDDFSSFEDLMSDTGIEESWESDFPTVFPNFQPLACVDFDAVDEFDSYAEFLLLVDTSSADGAVYWFSAEWWDWDEWQANKNGFHLLADSFSEFYESLVDYQGDE